MNILPNIMATSLYRCLKISFTLSSEVRCAQVRVDVFKFMPQCRVYRSVSNCRRGPRNFRFDRGSRYECGGVTRHVVTQQKQGNLLNTV